MPDFASVAVPVPGLWRVLIGGFVEGETRLVVWGIGIAIQVLAAFASGGSDYDIRPADFAERHALFVIIALGEIVVAVGLAAAGGERDVATAIAVGGAFLVAAVLWWAYFDWLATAMERALAVVTGSGRTRAARDLFTLGHIPLIVGVVLYAVAAEEAAAHPGDHLEAYGRTLLALAVALAIGAYVYLAYRSDRFIVWERLAAGALAAAAILGLPDLSGRRDPVDRRDPDRRLARHREASGRGCETGCPRVTGYR